MAACFHLGLKRCVLWRPLRRSFPRENAHFSKFWSDSSSCAHPYYCRQPISQRQKLRWISIMLLKNIEISMRPTLKTWTIVGPSLHALTASLALLSPLLLLRSDFGLPWKPNRFSKLWTIHFVRNSRSLDPQTFLFEHT